MDNQWTTTPSSLSGIILVNDEENTSLDESFGSFYQPTFEGSVAQSFGDHNDGLSMTLSPQASLSSDFLTRDLSNSEATISVSTSFHPTAHSQLPPSDIALVSQDGVIFYIHSFVILKATPFAFRTITGGSLDDPNLCHTAIPVPSASPELNIILHGLYNISPASHSPTIEQLVNAVDTMPSYSLPVQNLIHPDSALFIFLLSIAPLHPMTIFVLAAHHGINELAVSTSAHLLDYPVQTITDEQAERMGVVYLQKLINLHLRRSTSFKNLLLVAPLPHAPSKKCGFVEQRRLTRAWALATASIAWDSRLDLATYNLQASLEPLTEDIDCQTCKDILQARIDEVVLRWTAVEHTI